MLTGEQLERLVGAERLGAYAEACAGDHPAAVPRGAHADVLLVAGYLDADLPAWIARSCTVPALLRARP